MNDKMPEVTAALAALMLKQKTLLQKAIEDAVSLAINHASPDTHGRSYCEISYDDIEAILIPMEALGITVSCETLLGLISEHPAVYDSEAHNSGSTLYLVEPIASQSNSAAESRPNPFDELLMCAVALRTIGQELGQPELLYLSWVRFAGEIAKTTGISPAETAKELCDAFREVKNTRGQDAARFLFRLINPGDGSPCCALLLDELRNAAAYLHGGGAHDNVVQMAREGAFRTDPQFYLPQRPENGLTLGQI